MSCWYKSRLFSVSVFCYNLWKKYWILQQLNILSLFFSWKQLPAVPDDGGETEQWSWQSGNNEFEVGKQLIFCGFVTLLHPLLLYLEANTNVLTPISCDLPLKIWRSILLSFSLLSAPSVPIIVWKFGISGSLWCFRDSEDVLAQYYTIGPLSAGLH